MSGSGSNGWMSLIFRIFARWFPRGLLVQFPPLAVPGNLRYHLNLMEFYVGVLCLVFTVIFPSLFISSRTSPGPVNRTGEFI